MEKKDNRYKRRQEESKTVLYHQMPDSSVVSQCLRRESSASIAPGGQPRARDSPMDGGPLAEARAAELALAALAGCSRGVRNSSAPCSLAQPLCPQPQPIGRGPMGPMGRARTVVSRGVEVLVAPLVAPPLVAPPPIWPFR